MSHLTPASEIASRIPDVAAGAASLPTVRTDGISVFFTDVEHTLAAARVASRLGTAMRVPIKVIVPRPAHGFILNASVSPTEPEIDAFARRLEAEQIDARICVCVYRDERQVIASALHRRSLVVMAGRRHWWPTTLTRWRRRLEAAGHLVVFVDSQRSGADAVEAAHA
ncbi:MAG TPA: hypothetical protein VH583_18615 [Vicinamibacterales bacterium]|jgi:hypothetical protein